MKKYFKKAFLMVLGLSMAIGLGITHSRLVTTETEAQTPQTHRRVYVYTKDDWAQAGDVFIHYWGGAEGTDWEASPQMEMVLNDYYRGMYYYDIPIDVTTFLVKDDPGTPTIQSSNILISDVFPVDDFKIPSTWEDGTHWAENDAGMGSEQLAAVLNHIDSCSPSYAGGYNAWPQLNNLFVQPSTYEPSEIVTDNFGDSTTIGDKIDYISRWHSLDQAGSLPASNFSTLNNERFSLIALIGLISLGVGLAGYYFTISRKKIKI
jgi:hypothetical protein